MALVCTELDAQILWKQNIPVVMIKVLDRFIDSGNEIFPKSVRSMPTDTHSDIRLTLLTIRKPS